MTGDLLGNSYSDPLRRRSCLFSCICMTTVNHQACVILLYTYLNTYKWLLFVARHVSAYKPCSCSKYVYGSVARKSWPFTFIYVSEQYISLMHLKSHMKTHKHIKCKYKRLQYNNCPLQNTCHFRTFSSRPT